MTKTELEGHAFWDRYINIETEEVLDLDDVAVEEDNPDLISAKFILRVLALVEEVPF